VVELRKTLRLPLDDLLAVVREFITPNVSRSGLDRCLHRHGVGSLKAMQPKAEKPGHKPFKCFITRGERTHTGAHAFDELCQALEIEHRLTKPRHPQTNGMVERFNGRISEVLATHRFDSHEALEATIQRYVWLYNHHIPQKALGHVTPVEAMKKWYAEKPEIFIKRPRNRPGPDRDKGTPLRERRRWRPFIVFTMVGAGGFFVDVAVLYIVLPVTGPYLGRVFSFWAAASATWWFNRRFTFRVSSTISGMAMAKEYVRYLVLMIWGGIVNYGVYVFVLRLIEEPWAPFLGVAAGSGAGLVVNYLNARYFVFREKSN